MHDQKGEIYITKRQRAFIANVVRLIRGFQKQDPDIIEKGRIRAAEITKDPKRVAYLLQKGKEASGKSDPTPKKDTEAQILLILKGRQLNAAQISQELTTRFKRKLDRKHVAIILNELKKKNAAEIISERTAYYWGITPKGEELIPPLKYNKYTKRFFAQRRQIAYLLMKGDYNTALNVSGIRNAQKIYSLLQQESPQPSYQQIGDVLGVTRERVRQTVGKLEELGIPLSMPRSEPWKSHPHPQTA